MDHLAFHLQAAIDDFSIRIHIHELLYLLQNKEGNQIGSRVLKAGKISKHFHDRFFSNIDI